MGFVVPPERERMMGDGRYEIVIDALGGAVSWRDCIVGDRFAAADVYVTRTLDAPISITRWSGSHRRSCATPLELQ